MIRTRFSPSPTGLIHLGNARAALFSALFAVHHHGVFLLRIEDTDAVRSEEKFIELLQDDLRWLGIHWQEGPNAGGANGPYMQSERYEIYAHYYQKLSYEGLAYPCFCSDEELALNRKIQLSRGHAPRYPGTCKKLSQDEINTRLKNGMKPALRFKVPENTVIEFTDLVKGEQRFLSDDIGDFIIRRADGSSSFMFCNAIDDSLMGTTHVLRGEDHLTNTPRQLMILSALKMRAPEYGHLSLITGDDGTPLSKRHGSSSLHDLREKGYLPIAVMNYLARLSHAYDRHELMTYDELAVEFQLSKISRAPARFDQNQLMHWQKEAVMKLDTETLWRWLGEGIREKVPSALNTLFAEGMRQNILFPEEALRWADIFFGDSVRLTDENRVLLNSVSGNFFNVAEEVILKQKELNLKEFLDDMKKHLNISGKNLFMPIRVALTGEQKGPDLQFIVEMLGKEKIVERFKKAGMQNASDAKGASQQSMERGR